MPLVTYLRSVGQRKLARASHAQPKPWPAMTSQSQAKASLAQPRPAKVRHSPAKPAMAKFGQPYVARPLGHALLVHGTIGDVCAEEYCAHGASVGPVASVSCP